MFNIINIENLLIRFHDRQYRICYIMYKLHFQVNELHETNFKRLLLQILDVDYNVIYKPNYIYSDLIIQVTQNDMPVSRIVIRPRVDILLIEY